MCREHISRIRESLSLPRAQRSIPVLASVQLRRAMVGFSGESGVVGIDLQLTDEGKQGLSLGRSCQTRPQPINPRCATSLKPKCHTTHNAEAQRSNKQTNKNLHRLRRTEKRRSANRSAGKGNKRRGGYEKPRERLPHIPSFPSLWPRPSSNFPPALCLGAE
jgi:hypothetical protein